MLRATTTEKNILQAANPPGKAAPPQARGLFHTALHPPGQVSQGLGLHSLSPAVTAS